MHRTKLVIALFKGTAVFIILLVGFVFNVASSLYHWIIQRPILWAARKFITQSNKEWLSSIFAGPLLLLNLPFDILLGITNKLYELSNRIIQSKK